MSVLDDVAAKVKASIGQNAMANSLVDQVVAFLHNPQTGGLQGLVSKFQNSGLGAQVQSWIGTGKNLPVTGEQIRSALGSEQISALATKAGLSPEQVTEHLATVLPQVVDHLTPTGQLPTTGALNQLGSFLKGGETPPPPR